MSNGKNHNSVIFLTTLGVYLGLVLVGATPQVLAQATPVGDKSESEFRKNNRLEFEKPISDDNLFVPQLIRLVNALNTSVDFGWNEKVAFTIEELAFCESDYSPAYMGSGAVNEGLYKIFSDFGIPLGREIAKRKSAKGFGDVYSHQISFDFSIEDSGISVKTTIHSKTPKENDAFVVEFNDYFARFASATSPLKGKGKVIYDGTKISSANDQIFIVTNLPRAGLDSLLAKDAK